MSPFFKGFRFKVKWKTTQKTSEWMFLIPSLSFCNLFWWPPTSNAAASECISYSTAVLAFTTLYPALLYSSSSLVSQFDSMELRAAPHIFRTGLVYASALQPKENLYQKITIILIIISFVQKENINQIQLSKRLA